MEWTPLRWRETTTPPRCDSHSRDASHAPAHDHTHPDGSLYEHREEQVTSSPIAAPLGAATLSVDTGTASTDMACDQSATHITGAPQPAAAAADRSAITPHDSTDNTMTAAAATVAVATAEAEAAAVAASTAAVAVAAVEAPTGRRAFVNSTTWATAESNARRR